MSSLKTIILLPEPNADSEASSAMSTQAAKAGLTLLHFSDLVNEGQVIKNSGKGTIKEPTANDCYIFTFTSGTTGIPKAVKIAHKQFTGQLVALEVCMGRYYFTSNDVHVSFLPLAHVLE